MEDINETFRKLRESAKARPYPLADMLRGIKDPTFVAGNNPDLVRLIRYEGPGVLAVRVILSLDEDEEGWKRHASMAAHSPCGGFSSQSPDFFKPFLELCGFGSKVTFMPSPAYGKSVWHFYEKIEDPKGKSCSSQS